MKKKLISHKSQHIKYVFLYTHYSCLRALVLKSNRIEKGKKKNKTRKTRKKPKAYQRTEKNHEVEREL